MIDGNKVIVILPAYNAARTLKRTYDEIPFDIVDDVILTDDFSRDATVEVAKKIGIQHIIEHSKNTGYGGNQKSCYNKALALNADIIVMLHPDYQYTPRLIPAMCKLISSNLYDVVLGSRILNGNAVKNGMPVYKYVANRFLTFIQNLLMNQKFSEFHTGYRCFRAKTLQQVPYHKNSDDFIFDNQIIAQLCSIEARFGEISCPAKYEKDSSSINFTRSLKYGFGVLKVSIVYFFKHINFKKKNAKKHNRKK